MESATHNVCQTCGLQFATVKARNMHEVRVHGTQRAAQCAANVGKHVLGVSVVRTNFYSTRSVINVLKCKT